MTFLLIHIIVVETMESARFQNITHKRGEPMSNLLTVHNDEKEMLAFEHYQTSRLTLQDLLRQTGLGIKIRFLVALTLIAVLPAVILVLILGDPSGREQQGALTQALALQAQAQAMALNQAIELRQSTVIHTAANPSLASVGAGDAAQEGSTIGGATAGLNILQTAQQADPSSLTWMVLQSDGMILADSSMKNTQARLPLASSKVIANPGQLLQMVNAAATGTAPKHPLVGIDDSKHTAWLAFTAPIVSKSLTHNVLLAVFSLPKLSSDLVNVSNMINAEVAVLFGQNGDRLLSAGTLKTEQKMRASMPASFKSIEPGSADHSLITQNPMTGRTDVAVAAAVPALNANYILLAPQDTQLVPSNRVLFAGRNTPLLILVILVAVLLVATGVALPIVRPIRRATRRITSTTEEVRQLANDARRMAQEHSLGTSILSGANKRFSGRRQSIIRDSQLIQQVCTTLWPRMRILQQIVRQDNQSQEVFQILQSFAQGLRQIHELAVSISDGLQKDNTLNQLGKAMESAQEISEQFEEAGTQLEQGASDLEYAAKTLL